MNDVITYVTYYNQQEAYMHREREREREAPVCFGGFSVNDVILISF